MQLIYTLTLYDVTNTAHLLALDPGQGSGHDGIARRTDGRRHAAGPCGFESRQCYHKCLPRREGDGRSARCRPENGCTRVQRPKTAQQAHEELSIGGGEDFQGRDKDAEGSLP